MNKKCMNKKLIVFFILVVTLIVLLPSIVEAKDVLLTFTNLDVYESSSTALGEGTAICTGVSLTTASSCSGTLVTGHTYRFEATIREDGADAVAPGIFNFNDVVAANDVLGDITGADAAGCNGNSDWTAVAKLGDLDSTPGTACTIAGSGGTEVYYVIVTIANNAGSGSGTFFVKIGGDTDTSTATSFTVVRPTWVSYSDLGHTTECNDFASPHHTVYMSGSGFPLSKDYKIIYWDAGGFHPVDDLKSSDGNGVLNSSHIFASGDQASPPSWHATVYYPESSNPGSYDPTDPDLVVDDTFDVQPSAIPEFSTVIAAIAVGMLCAVAYVVMRRKEGKR